MIGLVLASSVACVTDGDVCRLVGTTIFTDDLASSFSQYESVVCSETPCRLELPGDRVIPGAATYTDITIEGGKAHIACNGDILTLTRVDGSISATNCGEIVVEEFSGRLEASNDITGTVNGGAVVQLGNDAVTAHLEALGPATVQLAGAKATLTGATWTVEGSGSVDVTFPVVFGSSTAGLTMLNWQWLSDASVVLHEFANKPEQAPVFRDQDVIVMPGGWIDGTTVFHSQIDGAVGYAPHIEESTVSISAGSTLRTRWVENSTISGQIGGDFLFLNNVSGSITVTPESSVLTAWPIQLDKVACPTCRYVADGCSESLDGDCADSIDTPRMLNGHTLLALPSSSARRRRRGPNIGCNTTGPGHVYLTSNVLSTMTCNHGLHFFHHSLDSSLNHGLPCDPSIPHDTYHLRPDSGDNPAVRFNNVTLFTHVVFKVPPVTTTTTTSTTTAGGLPAGCAETCTTGENLLCQDTNTPGICYDNLITEELCYDVGGGLWCELETSQPLLGSFAPAYTLEFNGIKSNDYTKMPVLNVSAGSEPFTKVRAWSLSNTSGDPYLYPNVAVCTNATSHTVPFNSECSRTKVNFLSSATPSNTSILHTIKTSLHLYGCALREYYGPLHVSSLDGSGAISAVQCGYQQNKTKWWSNITGTIAGNGFRVVSQNMIFYEEQVNIFIGQGNSFGEKRLDYHPDIPQNLTLIAYQLTSNSTIHVYFHGQITGMVYFNASTDGPYYGNFTVHCTGDALLDSSHIINTTANVTRDHSCTSSTTTTTASTVPVTTSTPTVSATTSTRRAPLKSSSDGTSNNDTAAIIIGSVLAVLCLVVIVVVLIRRRSPRDTPVNYNPRDYTRVPNDLPNDTSDGYGFVNGGFGAPPGYYGSTGSLNPQKTYDDRF